MPALSKQSFQPRGWRIDKWTITPVFSHTSRSAPISLNGQLLSRQSPVNAGLQADDGTSGAAVWRQAPEFWVQTPINGQPVCRQWDAYRFYRPN